MQPHTGQVRGVSREAVAMTAVLLFRFYTIVCTRTGRVRKRWHSEERSQGGRWLGLGANHRNSTA